MAWDLATAREAVGLAPGDTSSDVALQRLLDATLATVEKLLGRGLLLSTETAIFYDVDSIRVRLPRYPVTQVTAVNGSAPSSDIRVHYAEGWIDFRSSLGVYTDPDGELSIDYEGGFDPLPADLERALWEIFRVMWDASDSTSGMPLSGVGTTVVAGSGEVSRVTLADFGTISYDVASSVSQSNAALAQDQKDYGWLAPWASILSAYRSEIAPSVVFA